MLDLEVDNATEWQGAQLRAFADLRLDGEKEVDELAEMILEGMRDRIPVDASAGRSTSRRRARAAGRPTKSRRHARSYLSIQRGRDADGQFWDGGATLKAFYASFLEWGTTKMPARPWARPSIESAIERWRAR